MNDRIVLEGIEFYAFHGVSDEEQKIGHRFVVDMEIETNLRHAGATDDLHNTISYSDVARLVVEIGTNERFRLLERLADRLVEALFKHFTTASSVTIKVGKRLPPAKVILDKASVQISRSRKDLEL
ncbi:MAG: dihydroneopterin aldolase [bacterium]|jgi:dihydroneopterin aldolase